MAVSTIVWRLASPYDAYVSHVARLNHAIDRIKYLSGRALGYEAGLQSSVRMIPGEPDAAARAARFRVQLGAAAERMSDEEFEGFIAMLGGGSVAEVEHDRANTVARMSNASRGLEEYFGIAGQELTLLEKRGFSPSRPDISRQLRENGLPVIDSAQYRHELHELGAKVGKTNR